ncbi:MAG: hypothetical protein LKE36_03600 [Bacilli bacterium]|jgi:hypothetical protein|nr:hypothetical protein [Bacilli bacterium]
MSHQLSKIKKLSLVLVILIGVFCLLFSMAILFNKIKLSFLPLYQYENMILISLMSIIALLVSALYVINAAKIDSIIVFFLLSFLSAMPLFYYGTNGSWMIIFFIITISIAGFPLKKLYKFAWILLATVVLLFLIFWFQTYKRPVIFWITLLGLVISLIYVLFPHKIVKITASFLSLAFPYYALSVMIILSSSFSNLYIEDNNHLEINIQTPAQQNLKVIMDIKNDLFDQILDVGIYKPLGIGFYQRVSSYYFVEYYQDLNFTFEDFQWLDSEAADYLLVIEKIDAEILITL